MYSGGEADLYMNKLIYNKKIKKYGVLISTLSYPYQCPSLEGQSPKQ